jgi:type IV secretory pathway VirB10-like protein
MRQTEASGWIVQKRPRAMMRALRLASVVLGIGLLASASAARAEDDEDDSTFEEKIIKQIMTGIGGTNMENTGIDYRERSPLVVPPKIDLPPPASAAVEAPVPNWPKDPEVRRRKEAKAARQKDNKDPREASRVLTPSELAVGKTAPAKRTAETNQPGDPGASAILSPSQLGFDGGFMGMFKGSKTESAPFKGEPTRDTLTMPPPGYQTPSPGYAYGTGPKESLVNKVYNPSQGKYGD